MSKCLQMPVSHVRCIFNNLSKVGLLFVVVTTLSISVLMPHAGDDEGQCCGCVICGRQCGFCPPQCGLCEDGDGHLFAVVCGCCQLDLCWPCCLVYRCLCCKLGKPKEVGGKGIFQGSGGGPAVQTADEDLEPSPSRITNRSMRRN